MGVDLIIFDLDGTLVDSCEDITNALNYCLKERGYEGLSSNIVKTMIGEGVKKLIQKVIEYKQLQISSEEMIECFVSYYKAHITDFTKPYPKVKETLKILKNIKKAIISNKLTELTIQTVKNLSLIHYFDFIGGSDSFQERKPSALPIIEVMKKLNSKPENTIIVGDSELDIKAGKSAKIKTVAVTYGYGDKDSLSEADFKIDRFEDLIEIVKKL
ncbi:MAG: HAD-IA family hydrolase [Thermodesulfovibrio sp.]|nr:HAD-IA family hydrolase [Thermodesulfovibrio sp.]